IDEIGEINDHIQNEAGHGANIIMGVGEDEKLEESIGVTIIATGFNIEQQDEISNSETKRVIHSLIDEKELAPKVKEPVIIVPVVELETKKEIPQVRHTLNIEEEEEVVQPNINKQETKPKSDHLLEDINLIPTSDIIKNIKVVYEEVKANIKEDDDFIIKPV